MLRTKNLTAQGFPQAVKPTWRLHAVTRGKQHPHIPTVAALSTKTKQPKVSLGLLVIENQSQFTG